MKNEKKIISRLKIITNNANKKKYKLKIHDYFWSRGQRRGQNPHNTTFYFPTNLRFLEGREDYDVYIFIFEF